jgi:hypothetical protein
MSLLTALSARGLPLASNTRLYVRGVCCLILIICLLYICIIFSEQFFWDVQKVCPFAFCWDNNFANVSGGYTMLPRQHSTRYKSEILYAVKMSKEISTSRSMTHDWSIRMMEHFSHFYIELFRQVSATTSANFEEHKATSEFLTVFRPPQRNRSIN